MLGNDVRNAMLATYEHGCISSPFYAVSMDNVWPTILPLIVLIHRADNSQPAIYIVAHPPRQTTLVTLTDCDARHLLLIASVRKRKEVAKRDGDSELDITQYANLMAKALQCLRLVETEQTTEGWEK